MELKGSCHCGSVKFTVKSPHPYPCNLCYCSICRQTAGGGGFAINLGGRHKTLKVAGRKNITVYRARMRDEASGKVTQSTGRRPEKLDFRIAEKWHRDAVFSHFCRRPTPSCPTLGRVYPPFGNHLIGILFAQI